jgi:hypothetical protein
MKLFVRNTEARRHTLIVSPQTALIEESGRSKVPGRLPRCPPKVLTVGVPFINLNAMTKTLY